MAKLLATPTERWQVSHQLRELERFGTLDETTPAHRGDLLPSTVNTALGRGFDNASSAIQGNRGRIGSRVRIDVSWRGLLLGRQRVRAGRFCGGCFERAVEGIESGSIEAFSNEWTASDHRVFGIEMAYRR